MRWLTKEFTICRAAERYGRRYVKEFATKMRRELGMKVLVLTAHIDTKEVISYSAYVIASSIIGPQY